MQPLQKRFFGSGNFPPINKGTGNPSWLGNEGDNGTWYNAGGETRYFYNVVDNETVYVQYGKNQDGWASGRFFAQSLDILEEVEEPDGSITATVEVQALFFKSRLTDYANAGFQVAYNLLVNNQTQYTHNGNSIDILNFPAREKITFTVNVQPEETATKTAFEWRTVYTAGEGQDSTTFIGFALYNPNPATYVPMAIRKSGTFKALDANNGFIKKRVSSNWNDYSNENNTTQRQKDKGKNRIRRSSDWLQLPKM
jgi:hypothetical protein